MTGNVELLDALTAAAGVLAALAGLFAAFLGLTRTARLRRREQMYRESMASLSSDDPRRPILGELQRAAMAEIIARQLTAPWRAFWPWAGLIGIVVLFIPPGEYFARYLATGKAWNYYDFGYEVLGDPFGVLPTLLVVFGAFPVAFASYLTTITGRATAARAYFRGEPISKPDTYSTMSARAEVERLVHDRSQSGDLSHSSNLKALAFYLWTVCPGLAALSLGMNIGMNRWIGESRLGRVSAAEQLGAFAWILPFSMALLLAANLALATWVLNAMRAIALPSSYPQPVPSALLRQDPPG